MVQQIQIVTVVELWEFSVNERNCGFILVIYAALFNEINFFLKLIKDVLLYEGGRDEQGM